MPLDLQQFHFSQCILTYKKSDSDYKVTVASCKQPVTFEPIPASNPGDGGTLRCTVPEEWSASVKDTLHASRAERDKTRRMCSRIKELLRESSNEIWQYFHVASNAINANIDRIHRDRSSILVQLALVRCVVAV